MTGEADVLRRRVNPSGADGSSSDHMITSFLIGYIGGIVVSEHLAYVDVKMGVVVFLSLCRGDVCLHKGCTLLLHCSLKSIPLYRVKNECRYYVMLHMFLRKFACYPVIYPA